VGNKDVADFIGKRLESFRSDVGTALADGAVTDEVNEAAEDNALMRAIAERYLRKEDQPDDLSRTLEQYLVAARPSK